jgi:hypothetical protein
MTIDSGGVVNIPKQDNAYELIKAYSSASNNTLSSASGSSTGGHINFEGVFQEHYLSYKLVIGFYGSNHGSTGHSINIRLLTSTRTEVTASSYRWHLHRMLDNDDNTYTGNNNSSDDRWQIFRYISNTSNAGMHGEIDFYNCTNVTVEGQSSSVRFDSTADLAPVIKSEMIGFDTNASAYTRASSLGRYNTSNINGYYTGFTLMGETGERAGTHMALYGLRTT